MVAFFDQTIAPERRADPTLLPPESIARRRAMAERMLTEAGDYSPVQHWTQAAARVFGGAVGALGAYNADQMAMRRESAERGKGDAESAQATDILMGLYPGGPEGQAPAQGQDPQQFAQDRTAMARSILTGGDPASATPAVMRSLDAQPPAEAAAPPQPNVLQGMPSYNQLKAMLGNPSTRAMGIEYLKEIQRRAMPPDEQTRLDMDLKRAQIAKMQRGDDQQPRVMEVGGRLVRIGPDGSAQEVYAPPPGATGQTEYGLVPQYAQDAQGNIVPWVAGKSGEPKMLTLPDGVRALAPADTAYQRAQGKELGEAAGSAQADLQRVTDNANLALTTIQRIRQHPGRGAGLGMSAPMGLVPGSEARGFANLVDQAAGQTFLEAFNSLRGGGQITEVEGRKATQALARLDRYQSEGDFMQALKDLEDVINIGVQRARTRAGGFATQPPPAAPPQASDPLGIR